jgi:hypothetical protein
MIELIPFITALQCSWFKRLHNGVPDTYKEVLIRCGACKVLNLSDNFDTGNTWPILRNIWKSFRIFYTEFAKVGRNWEKLPVLYHPLLRQGGGGEG